jgi:O-antigen ligase
MLPALTTTSAPAPNQDTAAVRRDLDALSAVLLVGAVALMSTTVPLLISDRLLGPNTLPVWVIYSAVYGSVLVVFSKRLLRLLAHTAGLWGVALLHLLPMASVIWSSDAKTTLPQALMLSAGIVISLALWATTREAALRVLCIAAIITPLLSILAIVMLPEVGREIEGAWTGTWRGVHEQKNGLGALCAVSVLLLAAAWQRGNILQPSWLVVGLALNAFLLLGSRSTTSLLIALACVPVLIVPLKVVRAAIIGVVLALGASMALLIANPDLVATLLATAPTAIGKDATLSNRTPIWTVLWGYVAAEPWFGYGYGAFWSDDVVPADVFTKRIKFVPSSAHNGVLEVVLALGLVGFSLLVLVTLQFVKNLYAASRLTATASDARLALALFVQLIILNVSESRILERNDRIWVIFVWLAVLLARPDHAASAERRVPSRQLFVV